MDSRVEKEEVGNGSFECRKIIGRDYYWSGPVME
jgi:hypothetical protein